MLKLMTALWFAPQQRLRNDDSHLAQRIFEPTAHIRKHRAMISEQFNRDGYWLRSDHVDRMFARATRRRKPEEGARETERAGSQKTADMGKERGHDKSLKDNEKDQSSYAPVAHIKGEGEGQGESRIPSGENLPPVVPPREATPPHPDGEQEIRPRLRLMPGSKQPASDDDPQW